MKTGVAKILLLIGTSAFLLAQNARAGVIFRSLYALTGNTYATLVQSSNGTFLYGTTVGGTFSPPFGVSYGSIFVAPTNAYNPPSHGPVFTNLHSFTNGDGGAPHAGV